MFANRLFICLAVIVLSPMHPIEFTDVHKTAVNHFFVIKLLSSPSISTLFLNKSLSKYRSIIVLLLRSLECLTFESYYLFLYRKHREHPSSDFFLIIKVSTSSDFNLFNFHKGIFVLFMCNFDFLFLDFIFSIFIIALNIIFFCSTIFSVRT